MSKFGNRSEPPRARTAQERERDRQERERRRDARREDPVPAEEAGSEAARVPPPVRPAPEAEPELADAEQSRAPDAPRGGDPGQPLSAPIARTRDEALEHASSRRFSGPGAERDGRHLRLPPLPHLPRGDRDRPGGSSVSRRRVFGGIALVIVAAVIWFAVSLVQPFHGSGSGRVIVDVPRGASARAIGDLLARDHVVSSGFFFSLRAALAGKRGSFRAGEFTLKRDMSYGAAIAALTNRSAVATPQLLVPEGDTRVQIAALARADGIIGDYLHASTHNGNLSARSYGAPPHTPSLEGFLFPATYGVSRGTPAKRLVTLQLEAFKRNFASVDLSYARTKHLTPYDVLIVASMIEREAALPSERPLIAAVIYNRLHLKMPLGIDATIRYALNDYTQPLTAAQLASPSPYNTRLRRNLPPTPIGNPGLAAIQAAAHPAHVPYVYYVVKPGTCGDAFSTTYAQFQRDVARYQSARAKAGGRSPTSCH